MVLLQEECDDFTTNSWTTSGNPQALNGMWVFHDPDEYEDLAEKDVYTAGTKYMTHIKVNKFSKDWCITVSDGTYGLIITENENRFITIRTNGNPVARPSEIVTDVKVRPALQGIMSIYIDGSNGFEIYWNESLIASGDMGEMTDDRLRISNTKIVYTWDMEWVAYYGTGTEAYSWDMENLIDWGTGTEVYIWDMEA